MVQNDVMKISKIKLNYTRANYCVGKSYETGNADVQNIYSPIETRLSGHLLCETFLSPKGKPVFPGTTTWQFVKQRCEVDIMFCICRDKETKAEVFCSRAHPMEAGKPTQYTLPWPPKY